MAFFNKHNYPKVKKVPDTLRVSGTFFTLLTVFVSKGVFISGLVGMCHGRGDNLDLENRFHDHGGSRNLDNSLHGHGDSHDPDNNRRGHDDSHDPDTLLALDNTPHDRDDTPDLDNSHPVHDGMLDREPQIVFLPF